MVKNSKKKQQAHEIYQAKKPKKIKRKKYERELAKLEVELVKIQVWIKDKGMKIAIVFEGRD